MKTTKSNGRTSLLLDEDFLKAGNTLIGMADELTIDELKDRAGDFTVVLEDEEKTPDQTVTDMLKASVQYEQEKLVLQSMESAVEKQRRKVDDLYAAWWHATTPKA